LLGSASLEDDGTTLRFSGVNVQIVSGVGATGAVPNGLGNLIVGYNEPRSEGTERSGSHNLVIGSEHNFTSHGGLVTGQRNSITGKFATVNGGLGNVAAGSWSSVCGGQDNEARGAVSSVGGGSGNAATGVLSWVSGGDGNVASGFGASVSGGGANEAGGLFSSVNGGHSNLATGLAASVHGGGGEFAFQGNLASGDYSVVGGGVANEAAGDGSVVGGGRERFVAGPDNWRAGSLFQAD
jgi:hypothetical protein